MDLHPEDQARRRRIATRGVLLCAIGLRVLSVDAVADQQEALLAAWNHRQKSIHSFHFAWSGNHFRGAQAVESLAVLGPGGKPPTRSDLSCKTHTSLYVDEKGRFRVDTEGQIWSREQSAYVPHATSTLLDGHLQKGFSSKTITTDFPVGMIMDGNTSDSRKAVLYRPITMAYRPFDTTMSYLDAGNLKMTAEQGMVDGRPCLILRQRTGDSVQTVWVDAGREFVPVRYLSERGGVTSFQVDVSHSKDAKYGWVPTSWSIALLEKDGAISESWDAKVVKYELNETIPESTFQLDYPPGTMVHDSTTKEDYLVLENGGKRPILRGEYTGTNYDELWQTKPPSEGVARRITLTVVCLLALLVVTAYLLSSWRRRVRQRA